MRLNALISPGRDGWTTTTRINRHNRDEKIIVYLVGLVLRSLTLLYFRHDLKQGQANSDNVNNYKILEG